MESKAHEHRYYVPSPGESPSRQPSRQEILRELRTFLVTPSVSLFRIAIGLYVWLGVGELPYWKAPAINLAAVAGLAITGCVTDMVFRVILFNLFLTTSEKEYDLDRWKSIATFYDSEQRYPITMATLRCFFAGPDATSYTRT